MRSIPDFSIRFVIIEFTKLITQEKNAIAVHKRKNAIPERRGSIRLLTCEPFLGGVVLLFIKRFFQGFNVRCFTITISMPPVCRLITKRLYGPDKSMYSHFRKRIPKPCILGPFLSIQPTESYIIDQNQTKVSPPIPGKRIFYITL